MRRVDVWLTYTKCGVLYSLNTFLQLTTNEMITTQPRVLIREPVFSIDGDNPLHFSFWVGGNSEESFVGGLTRSVSAADCTASIWHRDTKR